MEGIEVGSPEAAVRSSREPGLLNPEEAESALVMTDDRNLTAHTYNERIAAAIFGRLPRRTFSAAARPCWIATGASPGRGAPV